MRPLTHGACGALGGGAAYLASGSATAGVLFAGVHILMDLDHIADFLVWSRRPYRIKRFFEAEEWDNWPRVTVLLHAFEWLGLMLALLAAFPSWELAGATLGYGSHLLMDHFGNQSDRYRAKVHPLFYFIGYRIRKGFRISSMRVYSQGGN